MHIEFGDDDDGTDDDGTDDDGTVDVPMDATVVLVDAEIVVLDTIGVVLLDISLVVDVTVLVVVVVDGLCPFNTLFIVFKSGYFSPHVPWKSSVSTLHIIIPPRPLYLT